MNTSESKTTQKEEDVPVLRKPAGLIHSEGILTAPQRKMFNALLYHAYPAIVKGDTGTHAMRLADLKKLTGIKTRNTQWVRENLEALQSLRVDWDLLGELRSGRGKVDRNKPGGKSVPVPDIALQDDHMIYFAFSPWTANALKDRYLYGQLNLLLQADIRSKPGLITLEIIVRYQNWGRTRSLCPDTWRKIYGCEDRHLRFREFRKQVLEPSVREINEKTTFNIDIEYTRGKRNEVEAFRFVIDRTASEKDAESSVVKMLIGRTRLSRPVAAELVESYGDERVLEVMAEVDRRNSGGGSPIKNPGGWVRKALADKWKMGAAQSLSKESERLVSIIGKGASEEASESSKKPPQGYARRVDRWFSEVREYKENLPEAELEALKSDFMEQASTRIQGLVSRHGMDSKPVESEFVEFIYQKRQDELPSKPFPNS